MSDIAPGIRSLGFRTGKGCVHVSAVLSAQEPTINPELLTAALRQLAPELVPDFSEFRREAVFDAEMRAFS
jgi:hypothetical protein